MKIRIKVCGMRQEENLQSLIRLAPDFIGFIFFPKSKRFVGENFDPLLIKQIPKSIETVGVFVNESFETVVALKEKYGFDYLQLHGDESSEFCKKIKDKGYPIIKAFSVDPSFNFTALESYISVCDYFLFDTKGENYGGNGTRFDWTILSNYSYNTPFFLSGGIGPENAEEIVNFNHKKLYAIDINSKFEERPGLKSLPHLRKFFQTLDSLKN